jgi:hypothetical protein
VSAAPIAFDSSIPSFSPHLAFTSAKVHKDEHLKGHGEEHDPEDPNVPVILGAEDPLEDARIWTLPKFAALAIPDHGGEGDDEHERLNDNDGTQYTEEDVNPLPPLCDGLDGVRDPPQRVPQIIEQSNLPSHDEEEERDEDDDQGDAKQRRHQTGIICRRRGSYQDEHRCSLP